MSQWSCVRPIEEERLMSVPTTVDRYADAIAQAMPPLTAKQLDLVVAAYRAMLAGKPSEIAAIAADAGWESVEAANQLAEWPGVYLNESNQLIGFWGLTVDPISTHVVTTESGSSWAWCALDPLFILPLVGPHGRGPIGGHGYAGWARRVTRSDEQPVTGRRRLRFVPRSQRAFHQRGPIDILRLRPLLRRQARRGSVDE